MENSPLRANLSPILNRAKVLLLIMSAALIIANLYFLSSTRQLADSYSARQNQATWFLFQLTKEFSELTSITPFAAEDEEYRKRTLLKYELTWSRFDLLLNSKEADTFIKLPGAKSFFEDLFNQYKALEPKLELIDQPVYATDVGSEFSHLYMKMIQYVNTNFRVQSPLYREQRNQAQSLHHTQLVLLILLFICAGLAGYIIHLEAKYHRSLSLTDSLTKVCNRLALFNDLNEHITRQTSFSLFLLDLNGFKQINDQFGHQAGDKALVEIAKRLSSLGLPCYRIGGDEFALLSFRLGEIESTWLDIEACFSQSINVLERKSAHLSTSIGVAKFPSQGKNATDLLAVADKNMYSHKKRDKRYSA